MKKLSNVLDTPSIDPLFAEMSGECESVVLYIEMLIDAKFTMDENYHKVKRFITSCNSILVNVSFFAEFGKKSKNPYPWLYDGVTEFLRKNDETYRILKRLRNSAVHQASIVPDNAFVFGLYKVMGGSNYRLKIGLGEDGEANSIGDRFLYKDTLELFHQLLAFHFVYLIDIDHFSIGECLGVTRRWVYSVDYKYNGVSRRLNIDLYDTISEFCQGLINSVRKSYFDAFNVPYSGLRIHSSDKLNNINTLLELDLYPKLFTDWWGDAGLCGDEVGPLNFGSTVEFQSARTIEGRHKFYQELYADLPTVSDDYIARLRAYESVRMEDFDDQASYDKFVRFVLFPHWYMNRCLSKDFLEGKFEFQLVMDLLELATEYVSKVERDFDMVSNADKNRYLARMGEQLASIRREVERVTKP